MLNLIKEGKVKIDTKLGVDFGFNGFCHFVNDYCIFEQKYNKKNWPSTYREIIIEGGNHAQFGFYNEQDGDGIANISNTDQINITKEEIIKFIKS